jgi:hypothetical protein
MEVHLQVAGRDRKYHHKWWIVVTVASLKVVITLLHLLRHIVVVTVEGMDPSLEVTVCGMHRSWT